MNMHISALLQFTDSTSSTATGDTKYLDRAASAVASLKKYLPQKSGGFAGLNDVDNPQGGFIDDQESFWFAEVMRLHFVSRL